MAGGVFASHSMIICVLCFTDGTEKDTSKEEEQKSLKILLPGTAYAKLESWRQYWTQNWAYQWNNDLRWRESLLAGVNEIINLGYSQDQGYS